MTTVRNRAKRWPKSANAVRLDCIAQAEEAHTLLSQALTALDKRNLDLVRQRIVDARKDTNLIRMMLTHAAPGDDGDDTPAIQELQAELSLMREEVAGLNEMIRDLLILQDAEDVVRKVDGTDRYRKRR